MLNAPVEPGIDCHIHIVDQARFPYCMNSGGYFPTEAEQGTVEQFSEIMTQHNVDAALLVQPSCYGADAAAMADAARRHPERFAMIAAMTTPRDGPRFAGVRLNIVNGAMAPDDPALAAALKDAADTGLWVEVQCPTARLLDYLPVLRASGARLIFDHLGYPDPALGPTQPGFEALLSLAGEKRHAVKLSGAFRLSRMPYPHDDISPFAEELLSAFGPDACVWGSDWPFVGARYRPAYAETRAILSHWVSDAAARRIILSDTPARLFGLGSGA